MRHRNNVVNKRKPVNNEIETNSVTYLDEDEQEQLVADWKQTILQQEQQIVRYGTIGVRLLQSVLLISECLHSWRYRWSLWRLLHLGLNLVLLECFLASKLDLCSQYIALITGAHTVLYVYSQKMALIEEEEDSTTLLLLTGATLLFVALVKAFQYDHQSTRHQWDELNAARYRYKDL